MVVLTSTGDMIQRADLDDVGETFVLSAQDGTTYQPVSISMFGFEGNWRYITEVQGFGPQFVVPKDMVLTDATLQITLEKGAAPVAFKLSEVVLVPAADGDADAAQ